MTFDPKADLNGATLSLRQMQANDWDAVYAEASKPALWAGHPATDRWQEPAFRAIFEGGLANPDGCYVIHQKDRDAVVGITRYYGTTDTETRIGYTFVALDLWGTGVNAELKKLMLDHAFTALERVYFDIGAENWRSRKAVEKLGAALSTSDDPDKAVYVLDKSTWITP